MPVLEVRPRRVKEPPIRFLLRFATRRLSLAIRWIIHFARQRGERGMENRLAGEIRCQETPATA